MTTLKAAYSANTAIVMDLSALGASTTFVAGRESTEVDNTTNLYIDAIVRGSFIVGTTPTLPCQLNVYVYGAMTTLTAGGAISTLDGADSAETITTTVLGCLKLGAVIPILVNTSDTPYYVLPFSVRDLFGGALPKFWGLFVAHNMTAALKTDAGNTNSFEYVGVNYTNA